MVKYLLNSLYSHKLSMEQQHLHNKSHSRNTCDEITLFFFSNINIEQYNSFFNIILE